MLRRVLRNAIDAADNWFQSAFGPRWNPIAQLGALGWLCFWIICATGLYLYVFFDTGVTAAYESVESITHRQWWAGGVLRSLHRYASDLMIAVAILHLVREFAYDRLRGARWFAWLTGVLLLPLLYICGVTGYWMVWDRLAQYIAQTTTEWLDVLPLFAEPVARNFLDAPHLSGRFFTLMAYIHIAAPLLLLLFMWVHVQRHSGARLNPVRGLGVGTVIALTGLSLAWPATSQPAADLATTPAVLSLDWFYLAVYPVIDRHGGTIVWVGTLVAGALLLLLPWLPPRRSLPIAEVDLANCNGCGRCATDCPFGAIELVARTDGTAYTQQAAVSPDRCVGCGICVAACPTATPFRRSSALVAGIEIPALRSADLRDRVVASAATLTSSPRILAFQCAHGAPSCAPDESLAVLNVPCIGMIPPSFLDFVLTRRHADGILLAGCRTGECHYRLGDRFTEDRIAGERDPALRDRISRDRIAISLRGATERRARLRDLANFRNHLAAIGSASVRPHMSRWPALGQPGALRLVGQVGLYGALALGVGAFSAWPDYRQLQPDAAVIKLSFTHPSELRAPCAKLTPEEMARLPINMRVRTNCRRDRWPVTVELRLDGRVLYRGTHIPAGLHDDGPSAIYRRFAVPAGSHQLAVQMVDSGRTSGYDYAATRDVSLRSGQSFVIDFDNVRGEFAFR